MLPAMLCVLAQFQPGDRATLREIGADLVHIGGLHEEDYSRYIRLIERLIKACKLMEANE